MLIKLTCSSCILFFEIEPNVKDCEASEILPYSFHLKSIQSEVKNDLVEQ